MSAIPCDFCGVAVPVPDDWPVDFAVCPRCGAPGDLPPAAATPCQGCPWRRTAARGWLGPLTADEWIALVHTDAPIACHETITVSGEWAPGTLQCRGAAIFRENVCKSPRDPAVVTGPVDRRRVFAHNSEFLEHHAGPLADWLADQRTPR